jgi:hypothetical protein
VPDSQTLTDYARALLADLGSTPDEIAAALVTVGVTGWPCDTEGCAIASYLRKNGIPVVWVDPEENDTGLVGFRGQPPVVMWPALSDFGLRFDREEFPALVGEPSPLAAPSSSLPTERS